MGSDVPAPAIRTTLFTLTASLTPRGGCGYLAEHVLQLPAAISSQYIVHDASLIERSAFAVSHPNSDRDSTIRGTLVLLKVS